MCRGAETSVWGIWIITGNKDICMAVLTSAVLITIEKGSARF